VGVNEIHQGKQPIPGFINGLLIQTKMALSRLSFADQTVQDFANSAAAHDSFVFCQKRSAAKSAAGVKFFCGLNGNAVLEGFDFIRNGIKVCDGFSEFLNGHGGPPVLNREFGRPGAGL
jgi:hypothetical protein